MGRLKPSAFGSRTIKLQKLQKWKDDYLEWKPEEWNDIETVTTSAGNIWIPDIEIVNRFIVTKKTHSSVNIKNLMDQAARIYANGSVEVKMGKVSRQYRHGRFCWW